MDKEYYTYFTCRNDADEEDLNFDSLPEYMKRCLALNNHYTFWGNGQDYMGSNKGQWDSDCELNNFDEMWELDDLNELANYYFRVEKKVRQCDACEGNGLSRRAEEERENIRYDNRNLVEEDLDALDKDGWFDLRRYGGRPKSIKEFLTASKYQEFTIDALRIHTILRGRAERGGYDYLCPNCQGNGCLNIDSEYHLALQIWMLHPRKGSSCGILIHNITEKDLPAVYKLLRTAKDRFDSKFDKLDLLLDNPKTDDPYEHLRPFPKED